MFSFYLLCRTLSQPPCLFFAFLSSSLIPLNRHFGAYPILTTAGGDSSAECIQNVL